LEEFDYLIVGAGAAGSVLASRLSEDATTRVLLVEAGRDLTPGREPDDIRNVFPLAAFNERYMWPDMRVHWGAADDSPAVPFPQGRLLGGSSNIMGMWALRGVPEDYDEWSSAGAKGWSWNEVVPFFRNLESDQDFAGALHGTEGPVPIRREPRDTWSPLALSIAAELASRGWPHIDDLNADFRDGHCAIANSRYTDSRASAGICYLTAQVRSRPNLKVVTGLTVNRVIFRDGRVAGVEASREDGTAEVVSARETVLTAGALRTPVLMMRSGIGPAEHLRALGIPVIADLPGVGENLQNHAVIYVCALLNGAAREPPGPRPAAATYFRWSSGLPGGTRGDMAVYVRSYLSWHALGRRIASLTPALQKPASRGRIRLDSADPVKAPRIEFRLLSDTRDLTRLAAGTRFAIELFEAERLKPICGAPFVLTEADRLMRFNRVSMLNALRAQVMATCLDVDARLGLALLRRLARMQPAAALAADDKQLREFTKEFVTGTGHVCGTCRIGAMDDALAVCDPAGRVRGVPGLTVADASVMPGVPSGNTHIPVIMVAEKIAAAMRSLHK
jgi:5-(hydroxymethyl)furfural/furfural oxidase